MRKMVVRLEPIAFALFRIVFGFLFSQFGTQKLFGWPNTPLGYTPTPLLKTAAFIELTCGFLIMIGLIADFAALLASGEMAFAYFLGHFPIAFWPVVSKGVPAVLFCFAFLFISTHGAGRWSFDRLWRERARASGSEGIPRMSIRTVIAIFAIVAGGIAVQTTVHAQEKPTMRTEIPKPNKSGYAAVNGLNYYYAIYGTGEPLLLLHGGMFSTEMFGPNLTKLAQKRQVIGVDLQGHGRTALGDREISLVDIGNDMAGVLKKLGYVKVDVLGYSMGGGVAFQFAVQHPQMVRRLVLVSTPYAQDGFYPEMLPQQAALSAALADQMKETVIYKSYVAIAPHPEDFPKLLDRMGAYMRKPYDWSEDVKKLTMPVMLIYGDSDMFRPEHEVKFYQLLGGGLKDAGWQREHMSQNRLAVLPNLTHYEIGTAPELSDTALPFLNGATSPGSSR